MYLDVCLLLWSTLAQSPAAPVVDAAQAAAQAAPHENFNVVRYILMVIYLLVCTALIFVVLNTNQSAGGLSGMLGGADTSHHSYQGKKTFEENLKSMGNYLSISFIVLSIVISYVMH